MTETHSSSVWGTEWEKMQKQYWGSWLSLYKQTLSNPHPGAGTNSLTKAFELWLEAASPHANESNNLFLNSLLQQSKFFMQFYEEAYRNLANSGSTNDWTIGIANKIKSYQESILNGDYTHLFDGMNDSSFFPFPNNYWALPLSFMREKESFFAPYMTALQQQTFGKMQGGINQFLSIPGVGYTREMQEQSQRLTKLYINYEQALQAYLKLHANITVDATERLLDKLKTISTQDEKVTSIKQLYDLWVDASEDAFSKIANSDEYSICYGNLINALSTLKLEIQKATDGILGTLNLPTQQGMRSLQARQHELIREIKALKSQSADSSRLHNEINTLRQKVGEIEGIKQQLEALKAEQKIMTETISSQSQPPASISTPEDPQSLVTENQEAGVSGTSAPVKKSRSKTRSP